MTRRKLGWGLSLVGLVGCVDAAAPHTEPSSSLALARFGPEAEALLLRPTHVTLEADGIVLERASSDGTTALRVPHDARGALELRLGSRETLRVFEEGARGASETIAETVSYARHGGRSYWTEAGGGTPGFEEWLEIAPGLAYGDRVLARWRVEGHALRAVPATGGVHVLDDAGHALVYVSAPVAWTDSGARVTPRLAIEDGAIVVRVDADGEGVLVDPSWAPAGTLSVTRYQFHGGYGAERLASGEILVVGGLTGGPTVEPATAERWDPITEVWSSAGTIGAGRGRHGTGLLADGRVLVTGGFAWATAGGCASSRADSAVYDSSADSWSDVAPMTQPRHYHTQTTLIDGTVLVAGGEWTDGACGGSGAADRVERYDPASNTWSSAASLATSRQRHTATRLLDGRVLVVGGAVPFSTTALASVEIYDPDTDAWSSAAGLIGMRYSHAATLLPDGRVLVVGGSTFTWLTSAEIYDPVANSWSSAASTTFAHNEPTATLLLDGRVLVVGGDGGLGNHEVYDVATNTWSSSTSVLARRDAGHVARALSDGSVLIAGGLNAGSGALLSGLYLADTTCGNGIVERGEACDGGPCCTDSCTTTPTVPGCCAADADCDDDDACTTDLCAAGDCTHAPACEPDAGVTVMDGGVTAPDAAAMSPDAAAMSLDAASAEDASVLEDASMTEHDASVTMRADATWSGSDASTVGVDAGRGEGRGCAVGGSSARHTGPTKVLLVLLAVFAQRRLRRRVHAERVGRPRALAGR
jgi:N-acetylneuraminic acid mutarotase